MQQNATLSEKDLSERQVIAIPHLVSSKTASETAELVGVNRKTIYRWLDDPAFRDAYDRQRDAVAKEIIDYDVKTATSHENQKLLNRLYRLIYNVEDDKQDERTVKAQVDQYLSSQERH